MQQVTDAKRLLLMNMQPVGNHYKAAALVRQQQQIQQQPQSSTCPAVATHQVLHVFWS
jgi:hypothetical protein